MNRFKKLPVVEFPNCKFSLLLLFFVSIIVFPALSENLPPRINKQSVKFGISYPPLSNKKGFEVTKRCLNELGVKLIRFDVHWKHREPQQDSYYWKPQDRRMEFLHQNGFMPVLTFHADAPDWVRDSLPGERKNKRSVALDKKGNKSFAKFVAAFIKRYKSKYPKLLQYFQFGNEWLSNYWYAGNASDFVATQNLFYQAIKSQLPQSVVILGGLASGQILAVAAYDGFIGNFFDDQGTKIDKQYVKQILKRQGKKVETGKIKETSLQRLNRILEKSNYDWIDVHLYDDYRLWPGCLQTIKNRLQAKRNLKFVVTEFGGPHPYLHANISENEFGLLLQKYLETLEKQQIEFALFFSLVRKPKVAHPRSGLLGYKNGKIIEYPVYEVFKSFNKGR